MPFIAVCSPRPRPMVQNGNRSHSLRTGEKAWGRDPYHIRRSGDPRRTRCGKDCSDWLVIGTQDEPTPDCCFACLSVTDAAKQ